MVHIGQHRSVLFSIKIRLPTTMHLAQITGISITSTLFFLLCFVLGPTHIKSLSLPMSNTRHSYCNGMHSPGLIVPFEYKINLLDFDLQYPFQRYEICFDFEYCLHLSSKHNHEKQTAAGSCCSDKTSQQSFVI